MLKDELVPNATVPFHAATGYATATSTAATWGPVVTGNIMVVGTDPGNHGLTNTASNTKTGSLALNDGAMSYVAGAHSATQK